MKKGFYDLTFFDVLEISEIIGTVVSDRFLYKCWDINKVQNPKKIKI